MNAGFTAVIIGFMFATIKLQKRMEKNGHKIEYLNLTTFNIFGGLIPLLLYLVPTREVVAA